jgi:hypothetical protein
MLKTSVEEIMSAEFNRSDPAGTEPGRGLENPTLPRPGVVGEEVPPATGMPPGYVRKRDDDPHGTLTRSMRDANSYLRQRSWTGMRRDIENAIGDYPAVSLIVGALLGYVLGRKIRS